MSSIITIIKNDHQTVENLWKKFGQTSDVEQRKQIAWTIIKELSVHAACEEEVLYPLLRKKYSF